MRLALIIASATLLLASGCDAVGSADSYNVTFLDLAGAEVSRATLTFDRPGAAETAGTYRYVSGLRIVTRKELRASSLPDGTVAVDLDLGTPDGGVSLTGPFSGGLSGGAWSVGTIAGPREAGTFRAERQ